ncbi:MAG: dihydrodipicolinate reductase [Gemmobacter sp.]|jgi:hypothetical protein|uniref:dihydrodipicolinate reductase n=1 Tax=Gemmobacter sp. TaxID=1898957 RepID=UPI00391BE76A
MRVLPVLAAGALALIAEPGVADTQRIESRDAFVSLVKDRALTRFGITLNVAPDGTIRGRAFGRPVTGAWSWKGGYFCRTLIFGDENLGDNCQLVEKRGESLRFTADQGKGDYADLRLR